MARNRAFSLSTWKSAIGEILLIVVGVLIALAASDWQTRRSDQRTEILLLAEMRESLTADLVQLRSELERYRRIDSHGALIQTSLRSGEPYSPEFDGYFGSLSSVSRLDLNSAAYESLKSQGLGLITDDELRSRIVRVYEQTYPGAEDAVEGEGTMVLDVWRPYLLRLFENVTFGQSATPLDYSALQTDVQFLNTLDYRLQIVRQSRLPVLQRSVGDVESLLDAIATELEGRRGATS